ncbi:hypothetical protein CsSME_00053582 [Camellia sinensis var. sinensis]
MVALAISTPLSFSIASHNRASLLSFASPIFCAETQQNQ